MVLSGDNPLKITFFVSGAWNTNSSGEFVDPWQTPYKLTVESTNRVTIRSAGKNKVFGDDDDVEMSVPKNR
jgi:hypothetical protein